MYLLNKTTYTCKRTTKKIIKCIDLEGRVRINTEFVPQLFYNDIVFISATSFTQNHKVLSKEIRKHVFQKIDNLFRLFTINNTLAIGGESYFYLLNNKHTNIFDFITNSESIYNDFLFNIKYSLDVISKKSKKGKIVNYNDHKINNNYDMCIVNLSSLNNNILHEINNNINKVIIIINCNHDEFWKRTKLLYNFKLMKRQQFVCHTLHYFITVNIFYHKSYIPTYISLGGNCAVTNILNRLSLRKEAYPFDWAKISMNSLNNVLYNDYKDYSSTIKLHKFSEKHDSSFIVNNLYNVQFAHEIFKSKSDNEMSTFIKSLNKRIIRMNKLKTLKKYPIFIRLETFNYKGNYDTLVKYLDNNYFDYKLIIITNNYHLSKENQNIYNSRVIYYYMNYDENWKYENIRWNDILTI